MNESDIFGKLRHIMFCEAYCYSLMEDLIFYVVFTRIGESLTMYNVCSAHRGMFSTSGGYHEYIGGYHEYIGGYREYIGGYQEYIRDVQYIGGYHDAYGGYHDAYEGCHEYI